MSNTPRSSALMTFFLPLMKAFGGLVLVFVFHIPKIIFVALQLSFTKVFNNPSYMTADVGEHLRRSRKLLKRGLNSELPYAAIELRFAVERMVQHDTWLAQEISMRIKKNPDPVKQLKTMQTLNENSKYPHDLIWQNEETGEQMKWGEYKPLNLDRINEIKGKLGDMLHPGTGPRTGFAGRDWADRMRSFLLESIDYIDSVYKKRTPFFLYQDIEHIQLVRKTE